jgi:hypothetical protein
MSLLDRIRFCQHRDVTRFRRFVVAGAPVGWVAHSLAERLRAFAHVFRVESDAVHVHEALDSCERRTRTVAEVLERLRGEGWFPGWRDEEFGVATAFRATPLMRIERAAARGFGVRMYCVQVNGVATHDGRRQAWIARRSPSKPIGPGKLDQVVGGAVPFGLSAAETLVKECAEEASIGPALARRARPTGAVAFLRQEGEISDDEVMFNYDLELPADFVPVNADGEVAGFELWPLARLRQVLAESDDFLFDVALSLIDFLVRHGVIRPDDPDYVDIAEGLWSGPRP